jgi:hypothetical protein
MRLTCRLLGLFLGLATGFLATHAGAMTIEFDGRLGGVSSEFGGWLAVSSLVHGWVAYQTDDLVDSNPLDGVGTYTGPTAPVTSFYVQIQDLSTLLVWRFFLAPGSSGLGVDDNSYDPGSGERIDTFSVGAPVDGLPINGNAPTSMQLDLRTFSNVLSSDAPPSVSELGAIGVDFPTMGRVFFAGDTAPTLYFSLTGYTVVPEPGLGAILALVAVLGVAIRHRASTAPSTP